MSWINDHIVLKDNQDLNIHWDSKPEKEYLNDKKIMNEYNKIIQDFYEDKQKYYYYERGVFNRFLYQYYIIVYDFSINRTWFEFKNVTLVENYLNGSKKIKNLSEIPWKEIFSFNKPHSSKFNSLISILDGNLYYKLTMHKSLLEKEKITFKYYLFKLLGVTQFLKKGGNYMSRVYCYFYNETIDLIYLFLLFFDNVHINSFDHIIALGYNPKISLIGELPSFFNKLFQRKFMISPKKELSEIIIYVNRTLQERIKRYQFIQKSNFKRFIHITNDDYIHLLIERYFLMTKRKGIINNLYQPLDPDRDKYDILYYLETNFQKCLRKRDSQVVSINNISLNYHERHLLKREFTKNRQLQQCLVINVGTGIICLELMIQMFRIKTADSKLYLIDQSQKEFWDNFGFRLIQQSGISIPIELLTQPLCQSLSKLDKKKLRGFNLVYFGGRYNYENIESDFFNTYKLLSLDGLLIIDFLFEPSIANLIASIEKNERYQLDIVEKSNLIVVYRKKN